jgi:hypothetical protein
VHFLKIDVEGFEGDVLRGMDFTLCRPWIVVVEAIMPNSRDSNHGEWEPLITAHAYQYAWFDGLNRYYVAAEHAELAARLQLPPNVFDDFLPHHLDKAWRRGEQLEQQVDTSWKLAQQHGARLAQLDAELITRQQSLLQLQQQLSARDQALQQRDQTLQQRDQQLQQREQELRQRHGQVLQLQADLRQTETQLQALDSRLHQTAAWGNEMEQRLLAVHASSSWRLTAPLRWLTRRGQHSLPNLLKRKARGALRRGLRWLSSRQWLRRALLPLVARSPLLRHAMHRTLHRLRMGAAPAAGAADVPYPLRELPQSARKALADLQRARHTHHP